MIFISKLRKRFGSIVALDGLDLEVQEGETMGLIGPDGSGKTTLLRILCGLLLPEDGICRIAGYDVWKNLHTIRTLVGYMPQRFSLYPDLTVSENLRFFADLFQVPKEERETRMKRLLEFSRLGPFRTFRASNLSGGMKQKLALSCILIHTPKVLLLDEPTAGVDPLSRTEFWEILYELRAQGVTILLTTPYMDEAKRCDRIAFISKGKVLAVLPPSEVSKLYSFTLMEVICENAIEVSQLLEKSQAFETVQPLGDAVHVSSKETPEKMKETICAILKNASVEKFQVQVISPDVEDVFVELLQSQ